MVIQVVNFNLEGIGHQDYLGATIDVAPAFKELSGLISKVWLSDEANNLYGGVYTWENRKSMEDYLNSEFYDQVLESNPNFINITYKVYDVLDEQTKITNPKREQMKYYFTPNCKLLAPEFLFVRIFILLKTQNFVKGVK